MRLHPARRITVDKIAGLFNTAYMKAATIEHATSGFRCTGIVPYNSAILPKTEFLSDPRDSPLSGSDYNTAEVVSTPSTPLLTTGNDDTPVDMTIHTSLVVTTGDDDTPVAFSSQRQVNFNDIVKVPEIIEKKKTKRSEESEIITGTLYKRALEESIEGQSSKSNSKKRKKILLPKKEKSKKVAPSSEDCECFVCGDW